MTIQVLLCGLDGTQTLETREVPEDYFSPEQPQEDVEYQGRPPLPMGGGLFVIHTEVRLTEEGEDQSSVSMGLAPFM